MNQSRFLIPLVATACSAMVALGQSANSCSSLSGLKLEGVEIAKAELIAAGATVPPPYPGGPSIGPLPAHCRVA
jgi:hypothetical protein